jgi:E3 ubiquitin-protein ligase HUWE1
MMVKAAIEKIPFPCRLVKPVYKYILGIPMNLHYLIGVDRFLYYNLCQINDDSVDIGNTLSGPRFFTIADRIGGSQHVELKSGGAGLQVTEANKDEYIEPSYNYRLIESVKERLDALKAGFDALFPSELSRALYPNQLEKLVTGLSKVNIEDRLRHPLNFPDQIPLNKHETAMKETENIK